MNGFAGFIQPALRFFNFYIELGDLVFESGVAGIPLCFLLGFLLQLCFYRLQLRLIAADFDGKKFQRQLFNLGFVFFIAFRLGGLAL